MNSQEDNPLKSPIAGPDEWKGFLGDGWKAATPLALQSRVADIRDLFEHDALQCLREATGKEAVDAFLNSIPYRTEADAIHAALGSWSNSLSVLAVKTLSVFLDRAYENSPKLAGYDPAVWAYAHTLSLIHSAVLGESDGNEKLPSNAPIRIFCQRICDGEHDLTPEIAGSVDLLDRWFASYSTWRAPLFLTTRAYTAGCKESDRWTPVDEAETESTLRWLGMRIVDWMEIAVRREAKIERIKRPIKPHDREASGETKSAGPGNAEVPTPETAEEQSAATAQASFDQIAGPLWKSMSAGKARKRVPDESLRSLIDTLKLHGFSDLRPLLEPAGQNALTEHNQKHNRNPIKTLDDFTTGILGKSSSSQRAIRRAFVARLSRAASKA